MMQAGVRLRQDTETTLPELPEQHRIREKEEGLHGLESVHMAESETKCTAPGPNTLEPECVTANSRVSDVDHTEASLIKTETDRSATNSGDLKRESLEFAEPAYVTHLCPDQIKAEHLSVFQDITCVQITSEEVKLESSDVLLSDLMSTEPYGAAVDEKSQTELWQCAGEPHPNFRETRETQSELIPGERVLAGRRPFQCSLCEKRFFNESQLLSHQRIHTDERPCKCDQCGKGFLWQSNLKRHQRIHTVVGRCAASLLHQYFHQTP
ncbi:hypothetical protein GJAV_G00088820, partial [Gymnothorax javanicus]